MTIIFIFGNLKVCLVKSLILLLHLIVVLPYYSNKIRVNASGSYLKQDKITYNHGQKVIFTLFMRQPKIMILNWKIVSLVQLH